MRRTAPLLLSALLLALPLAAQAGGHKAQAAPQVVVEQPLLAEVSPMEPLALHMDRDLAREHDAFSSFARSQVERMNANIIGGKHSMQVHKGSDGLYRASYKAIDTQAVVCQVRRSESNPSFYVGNLLYTEQLLQSVGKSAEACRRGPFEPVSEKANRLIYTSKRGGGWN